MWVSVPLQFATLRKIANKDRRIMTRVRLKYPDIYLIRRTTYCNSRRKLNKAIRKAKDEVFRSFCNELLDNIWGRPYRAVMKFVKSRVAVSPLKSRMVTAALESLFPIGPENVLDGEMEKIRNDIGQVQRWGDLDLDIPPVTEEEVQLAALSLAPGKAPGLDGVPQEIVRILARSHSFMFAAAFNGILIRGEFPQIWKTSRVVLIPKESKNIEGKINYRPLSVINAIPKLFEYVLKTRIMKIIGSEGFSKAQFGFRSGRSTLDALKVVEDFVIETNIRHQYAIMISLDISNAFNCLNWTQIAIELQRRNFPLYLRAILISYFQGREIEVRSAEGRIRRPMYMGVPQGSVIGPIIWNLIYDGLLNREMVNGTCVVGYADDVALLVRGKNLEQLESRVQHEASGINRWLQDAGLTLAVHKTAMVFLNNKWRPDGYILPFLGEDIQPREAIKYLGIFIDMGSKYNIHIEYVTNKAARVMGALSRLLPNISPLTAARRKLYYRILESIVLYAAPIWADKACSIRNKTLLRRTQRLGLSRVASSYRTASFMALCVITGEMPFEIKAKMRKKEYIERQRKTRRPIESVDDQRWAEEDLKRRLLSVRMEAMSEWQELWDSTTESRWTYLWIPQVTQMVGKGHYRIDFCVTQILTGHGCFRKYLYDIRKENSPFCWFECDEIDDANHTFSTCERWDEYRLQMITEMDIVGRITPVKVMSRALSSITLWAVFTKFCNVVMNEKFEFEKSLKRGAFVAEDDPLWDVAGLFSL